MIDYQAQHEDAISAQERADEIAAAALELYEHLVRRGCAHEDAAGAADMLVQDMCRQRKTQKVVAA